MRKYGKFLLIVLIILFAVASISIIAGAVILYRYSQSRVDEEILKTVSTGKETLFYRYDFVNRSERLGDAVLIEDAALSYGQNYDFVSFDQIPECLINAFVSIEDKRFWDHSGIDYLRSIKAIANYIVGGRKSFGGSTITQQLVKNLTGNDDYLVERKLTEAFCAINLERDYDKSEILEMYLNIINLSQGCRGVEAASRLYFSKSVSEIDLCEAACLAAITNNPSKYDPIKHPEKNQERRSLVLSRMLELGYITQDEYAAAINKELVPTKATSNTSKINSWYIDTAIEDVITDLAAKYNISRKTASVLLYRGGYKIYTLMDVNIQNILEKYYANIENFPTDDENGHPESSMIVLDPYTGDVLGIVGGVGKKTGNRILNLATDSKRPSGSAIKPLSIYAPAINNGLINWSSIFSDSPIREGNESVSPWPLNANRKYSGDVTVEYALKNSLNTVPVRILHEIGNKSVFEFLRDKLQIRSLNENNDMGDASLALGQHSIGITLRELVSAYSIFEEGIMSSSRTYSKVTDMNGKIILDNTLRQDFVIDIEDAAIMTKLMQEVVENGTAKGLISLAEVTEVAGKTGTTQNNFDKYFIGYTPTLLAGVWQGYTSPGSLDFIGGNYAAIIWDDIMSEIYQKTGLYSNNNSFKLPHNVRELSYDRTTGLPPDASSEPENIQKGWYDISHND